MKTQSTDLSEHRITTKRVYDGCLLHIDRDTVSLPDTSTSVRESVRHVGAVGIIALDNDGSVILERQFRYPVGKTIIEIPAGKLDDPQENRLSAAMREFREETGYTADNWICLGDLLPAPAYSDEQITLFLATNLHEGKTERDEDEFLEVFSITLKEAVSLVTSGHINDAKTQIAVMRLALKNNIS